MSDITELGNCLVSLQEKILLEKQAGEEAINSVNIKIDLLKAQLEKSVEEMKSSLDESFEKMKSSLEENRSALIEELKTRNNALASICGGSNE